MFSSSTKCFYSLYEFMKLEGSHLRRAFIAYGLKLLEDITVIRLNVILEKNIVRVCPYLRNLVGDKKT